MSIKWDVPSIACPDLAGIVRKFQAWHKGIKIWHYSKGYLVHTAGAVQVVIIKN